MERRGSGGRYVWEGWLKSCDHMHNELLPETVKGSPSTQTSARVSGMELTRVMFPNLSWPMQSTKIQLQTVLTQWMTSRLYTHTFWQTSKATTTHSLVMWHSLARDAYQDQNWKLSVHSSYLNTYHDSTVDLGVLTMEFICGCDI